MSVAFLDFHGAVSELRPGLDAAYRRVLDRGWFLLGEELAAFETEFASYCGARHCAGVGNGFDALKLALKAYGIGAGDEVIVPGNTCLPTWMAVSATGATPVPVEPLLDTYNLDPARVSEAITGRTRALVPVHLYGQTADMEPLMAIAEQHGLVVIEDAAQAAGARCGGRRVGTLGHAAAFSFYPTKNLGALADAGAVVTADAEIAEKVRLLRNYGSIEKHTHDIEGENSRLDELQAAFLRCKLQVLDEWNGRRQRRAEIYLERLGGHERLALPQVPNWAKPVWHLFVVRVKNRAAVVAALDAAGVGTAIHYPIPPHRSGAYREAARAYPPLPVTEALSEGVLSLPLHPHLDATAIETVADTLLHALR